MRRKVSIVGAGQVGSAAALRITARDLADVVLIDMAEGVPQGKALDLAQALPIEHTGVHITGSNDYVETANSDIVILTAGLLRKSGMNRNDLLRANFKIMSDVVKKVVLYSPESILIVVSTPLNAMVQAAYRLSGFNRERVLGMAGVLDASRFRSFIAAELNVNVEDVGSLIMGGHGDTMVPLIRCTTVAGIPITELLSQEHIDAIIQRVRDSGIEIVKRLKTGSTSYAPAAAAVEMAEDILKDKKKILSCSVFLQGEYGIDGCCVGVPCKLGTAGLEKILEIKLNDQEHTALMKSAAAVKELCDIIGM